MIESIASRDFRNLAASRFAPAPGATLILGGNGAGKTSLLEAAYLAATSKSFRTSRLADCARHGTDAFHVELVVEGSRRLEIGWQPGERLRLLDGKPAPMVDYLAVQPVVAWTTREAELLRGTPELSRRFMDRGLVSMRPGALAAISRFREVLAQKRELVAAGRRREMASWNRLFAEAAAELAARRRRFVSELQEALAAEAEATPGVPAVELEYLSSPRRAVDGVEATEAALARLAPREIESGRPLAGPHRDRLLFIWRGHELKRAASAGELKAFGLLLAGALGRLVEGASGRSPVYLLDDADSELARDRLASIWRVFSDGRQVLVSSNRPEVWEGLSRQATWWLEGGVVRPVAVA